MIHLGTLVISKKVSKIFVGTKNKMNSILKRTTVTLTCICLAAGCIPGAVTFLNADEIQSMLHPEVLPDIDPNDYDPQPGVSDDDPQVQPDYYDDAELINNEGIPTSLSFAQTVQEASHSYYDPCDEQGTLEYFYYDSYCYDTDESPQEKYAVVYTPYGYDASKKYDIMYLMHGVYGYAEIFLGYPEEPTTMKNCIDHLIEDGTINPMIIVCTTYYDHNEQQINDNEDADIVDNFPAEFKNDLMPAVETHYSTYAASGSAADLIASRDHRIFGGFSMGGVTTWYVFAQAMAYCRYYLPMSGMLYWGPDYPKKKKDTNKWSGQFLAKALKMQGYTKKDFFIYTATGGYDEAKPLLENQIMSMGMQNKTFTFGDPFAKGVNCTYAYSEFEEHSWQAVFQYLYNGLPVLSKKINQRSTQ